MRAVRRIASGIAVAAAVGGLVVGTGHAEPRGTVYFGYRGTNCAIAADGSVGCDFARPVQMSWWALPFLYVPMPFPVREVVVDAPWLPAHSGFAPGSHTLPGGNPDISTVATSRRILPGLVSQPGCGPGGSCFEYVVSYAGASCEMSYRAFECAARGHRFWGDADVSLTAIGL